MSATSREEACYLHSCLFRNAIDADTIERYQRATDLVFERRESSLAVNRVVERRLDPEAVEYVLRRRGLGDDLTRRLQILCYLAEVRAAYLSDFVNLRKSRAPAWCALAGSMFRSVWKLVKGEYLIRRHGIL